MLNERLDVTFTLIWSVALANILGAGICFALAGQFARLATVRAGILVPLVVGIMVVGAYQGSRSYGDLVVLLVFGLIGWTMKRLGWPRPPLILAFVLGSLVENYLFISQLRYGAGWMLMPIPFIVLCLIAIMLFRPALAGGIRRLRGGAAAQPAPRQTQENARGAELLSDSLVWAAVVALFLYVLCSSSGWALSARLLPQAVATVGLIGAAVFLVTRLVGWSGQVVPPPTEPFAAILRQIAWLVALVLAVPVIGMVPAIALFAAAYMLVEDRAPLGRTILIVVPFVAGIIFLFHYTLFVPWPQSMLGDALPELRRLTGRLL